MNGAHPTLDQLDLNLFRVFDVVYREGNLRRAAAVLSITPSAVSHALGRLRDQLGDPLFVRQRRGIAPTPRAAQLAPAVQEALAGLAGSLAPRRGFDPRRDLAQLVLALPGELEPLVLPGLLERLRRTAPQLQVVAAHLDRARLRDDLAAGRTDLALDVAQAVDAGVAHERVMEDVLCVAAARARRRLDRAAYFAAGHVVVSSRRSGPTLEDGPVSAAGGRRRVLVRCQRYDTACRVVAGSDLLLTLPRRQAELRASAAPLRLFPPPLPLPPVQFHAYWRREAPGPGQAWLRRELKAFLAES